MIYHLIASSNLIPDERNTSVHITIEDHCTVGFAVCMMKEQYYHSQSLAVTYIAIIIINNHIATICMYFACNLLAYEQNVYMYNIAASEQ